MNICILGNDKRIENIKKGILEDKKYNITDIKNADILIAQVPFSKDNVFLNGSEYSVCQIIEILKNTNKILFSGSISKDLRIEFEKNNIKYVDLLDFEDVTMKNAIATGEGAIKDIIESTDFTLNNSNILVLGYGRIGKILCKQLSGFGANIYVEARNIKDLSLIDAFSYKSIDLKYLDFYLKDMDIIINTIPHLILDKKRVKMLKKTCFVLDIASLPGGVDTFEVKKQNINYKLSLAIPSKTSPVSAAKYLKDKIYEILEEEQIYGKNN